jgi:hypothetical protein
MKKRILLPFILFIFLACKDEMVITNKSYIFYVAGTSENYNCELTLLGGHTAKTKTQKLGTKKTLLKTTISNELGAPQGIAYYTQEELYVGEVYEFRITPLDGKDVEAIIYESNQEVGHGFTYTEFTVK